MPRLWRYARSLTFDAATGDDLVQTVLERALSHWHQFDQRRDMLVWLLSIAHNAFLDQREPLLLVSVEQFSYAECAEALGIPIGTVMSRVSRGRVALRALLDDQGRTEPVRALRRVI